MNGPSRDQIQSLKRFIVLDLNKLPLKDAVVACEEIKQTLDAYKEGAETTIGLMMLEEPNRT